ncbi:hypothetical protein BT96DRAFT_990150 [Gymnopus androsaceus JB14]|uniref:Uncharacterized protein n=1 Tax=Gymnopus androsaceus JB14 TaxID=1447944 RepID=A0A6A4I0E7_9AGAR|nr:hypothetical protein BT96DRAFT_990150 [Gymnopus androsaceus JB14]
MATHLGELASSSPTSTPKLSTSASSEFINWVSSVCPEFPYLEERLGYHSSPSQEQWGVDLKDDVALLRDVFGVYPASPFTLLQSRISTLNRHITFAVDFNVFNIFLLSSPVAASVASTPVISLPAAPSSTFKCARKGCSLKSNLQHCTTGLCTKDCQARPDLNCLYHHRQVKKQGRNCTVPALSMLPLVGPIELSSAALSSSVSSSGNVKILPAVQVSKEMDPAMAAIFVQRRKKQDESWAQEERQRQLKMDQKRSTLVYFWHKHLEGLSADGDIDVWSHKRHCWSSDVVNQYFKIDEGPLLLWLPGVIKLVDFTQHVEAGIQRGSSDCKSLKHSNRDRMDMIDPSLLKRPCTPVAVTRCHTVTAPVDYLTLSPDLDNDSQYFAEPNLRNNERYLQAADDGIIDDPVTALAKTLDHYSYVPSAKVKSCVASCTAPVLSAKVTSRVASCAAPTSLPSVPNLLSERRRELHHQHKVFVDDNGRGKWPTGMIVRDMIDGFAFVKLAYWRDRE